MKLFSNFFRGERVTRQKYALCFEGTNNWDENFAFCVAEHKRTCLHAHIHIIYMGALGGDINYHVIYR